MEFYLDQSFLGGKIGIHPNENTATVWMETEDLIRLIQAHGSVVHLVEIE